MFLKIEQLCKSFKLEIPQQDKNKIMEKLSTKQFQPFVMKTDDEIKFEKLYEEMCSGK